jgi:hypothetical protein
MMHRLVLASRRLPPALPQRRCPKKPDCGGNALMPRRLKDAAPPPPVNIEANEMEILDAEKKAIFRGSVDA